MSGEAEISLTMDVGSRDTDGFYVRPTFSHHNYTALSKFLEELHDNYPSITRLYSIGRSVEGRELYAMELTAEAGAGAGAGAEAGTGAVTKSSSDHEAEKPRTSYVANVHGNEVVGRELLLLLCKYLCENYGLDRRVTRILEGVRLHVLPSLNPDGYERARLGDYNGSEGRANAHGVDIDEDFARFAKHQDESRCEAEVRAAMKWMSEMEFVSSGTIHGGPMVAANYPYGSVVASEGARMHEPDHEEGTFAMLAEAYASGQPSAAKSNAGIQCPDYPGDRVPPPGRNTSEGLRPTIGPLEDYAYRRHQTYGVAIEVSCYKYPAASALHEYWRDNLESMLRFVEAANRGLHGSVRSSIGGFIADAVIRIEGRSVTRKTGAGGRYSWLLPPGKYNVTATASNYEPLTQSVELFNDTGRLGLDFTLIRNDPYHWIHLNDYDLRDNLRNGYLKNIELSESYKRLELQRPRVAESKADDSPVSAAIHSFKITNNVGNGEETKIRIGLVGGLFASQPIGREILLRFARHVLRASQEDNPFIKDLLDRIVMYVVPAVDPAFDKVHDDCNPVVNDEVGKKLYAPGRGSQLDVITNAFEQMLLTEHFDALVLFGGGNGVNVSYASDGQIDIFKDFATYYRKTVPGGRGDECETRSDELNEAQNYIRDKCNVPVISFSLSCCKYPEAKSVPMIWRENLLPMKNLMRRLSTGALISVRDNEGNPLRRARVTIGQSSYNVSKNMAYFKAILPAGVYEAVFSCQGYDDRRVVISVREAELTETSVLLTRGNSNSNSNAQHPKDKQFFGIQGEVNRILVELNGRYPDVSTIRRIGLSKKGFEIMALEIHGAGAGAKVNGGDQGAGRPTVVVSAGIDPGSSVASRVLVHFVSRLLTGYGNGSEIADDDIGNAVSLVVAPVLNPDYNEDESCSYVPPSLPQFPLDIGKMERNENAMLIGKWFESIKPMVVVNLRVGSMHVEIPYGGRLGRDSQKPYTTDDEEMLRRLGAVYTLNHPSMVYIGTRCGSQASVKSSGVEHAGRASMGAGKNSLLDYLYLRAGSLPLDAYVACCGDDDDSRIWTENERSLVALLNETARYVAGYVVDEADVPVAGATVTHDRSLDHRTYSQGDGAYWLLLPPGTHSVAVDASGYSRHSQLVNVTYKRTSQYKLMSKLRSNDNVLGMPWAVFVILTGALLFGLVALAVFGVSKCQSRRLRDKSSRRPYAFSLLRDGNAFFDDDEKEVEIFRRPCKEYKEDLSVVGKAEPYFDDDDDDGDEDNSTSDGGGSDLEFIRPDRDWRGKVTE